MRWSEEQTVIFVKIYLQHEYLWNTKHEHYGQKYLRKKAYKTIGSLFEDATGIKLEEREVMTKIKNLGSTYAQEVAKIKKKAELNQPYTSSMKWFHYWHRCKEYNEPICDDTQESDNQTMWLVLSDNENNDEQGTLRATENNGKNIVKSEMTHTDLESENVISEKRKMKLYQPPEHSNIKRWSEDETVKFVRIYLKHEMLWNPNDCNFKKLKLRRKAYNSISSEFKVETGIPLTEKEVLIKIKSLKSTYSQEQAKIKRKSSSGIKYVSTLKWFADWDKCHYSKHAKNKTQESDDKIWLEVPNDEHNVDDDNDEGELEEKITNEETHIKTKWSEMDTMKFVKIYLQYDFLYDPKHKYFKQKKLRQEAYSSVSSEFAAATGIRLDENELKAKIKILGSTYAQELAKIKKRAGTGEPYIPTIKWFQYWHKHKYTVQKRNGRNTDDPQEPLKDWESTNEEESKFEPDLDESSHTQDSDCEEYEVKKKRFKSEKSSAVKSENLDLSDRISPSFVDTNSDFVKEDEFEHYGKYIASVLRSMDLDKALQIQLEIQNLLSEAKASSMSDSLGDS